MVTVLWVSVAAIVAAFLILLLLATRRPDSFHVQRSLVIDAPAATLYPMIAELKTFNTWNPFALRDPESKVTYEGPAAGVGARHTFDGKTSGRGSITVTGVEVDRAVRMQLVMTSPFKADNTVDFTLVPDGAGTRVTWAMSGRQPLLAKLMSMIIDCDRMVGREFEAGLQNLKTKVSG